MKRYKDLKTLFDILYSYYGPQGWWPVTQGNLHPIYRKNYFGPLTEDECFEIAIGAVLTQNVSWKNVERCIINLKKADLLTPQRIASIPIAELEALIIPSGYYRQKAQRLKELAHWIISNGGSFKSIFRAEPSKIREGLLSIKGIGKETADSILLYAGYFPYFVIDAYTKRLFKRLYHRDITDYDKLQDIFHSNVPRNFKIYNEFHALIVEHSKRFCRKLPNCHECPLKKRCLEGKRYGDR